MKRTDRSILSRIFETVLISVVAIFVASCMPENRITPEHLENGKIDYHLEKMDFGLELLPNIAILGENKVVIKIKDPSGLAIEDAHLNLSATSTLPGMKIERIEVNHGEKGIYEAKLHYLSVGQWKLTVAIHRFGDREIKHIYLFDVIAHS